MQSQDRNGELLFIFLDEYGMIGSQLVYELSVNLKTIQGTTFPFGKCCTVWFGDPRQLPPIGSPSVMSPKSNSAKSGSVQGYNEFHTAISEVVLLNQSHRQESDPTFRNILTGIRDGTVTRTQWERFTARVVGSEEVPSLRP